MTHRTRTFAPVPIPVGSGAGAGFARADIVVCGLEHGGPSYEIRIFLDNPGAGADTPQTAETGYAGSIHVYGYGEPPPPGPGDHGEVGIRPARSIVATEAVRAQARHGREVTVTLVQIAGSDPGDAVDLYADDVSVRIDEGAIAA